eukprot:2805245-Pyramimonas_sp.AAC.1
MGEVTFFYKGSGPPQVAKAQRNITMASTVCKLYYRHIRSLALDFSAMCLLDEQCGGFARKGPEMAVHGLHVASTAAHKRQFSTLILSLDLVDAFYSVIK